ncbi:MAG: chitin disaccharide deacetylase [Candidatus Acidiferrum sp.]
MKSLIVNADDLGWTEGVNQGIAESHHKGLVTSASLLANGRAFFNAVELVRHTPGLGIGVHLNLSDGTPVASAEKVKSLLDKTGMLRGSPGNLLLRLARHVLLLEEVEREWDAQIQKIRNTGIRPTHLDGHKHVHMLPGLFEIALNLAKRHQISAIRISHEASKLRAAMASGKAEQRSVILRQGVQAAGLKLLAPKAREKATQAGISTTDFFCGIVQTGEMTLEGTMRLVKALPEGVTEMMCHPGYCDGDLQKSATRLQDSRKRELEILTNTDLRNCVAQQGIRLISYKELAEQA